MTGNFKRDAGPEHEFSLVNGRKAHVQGLVSKSSKRTEIHGNVRKHVENISNNRKEFLKNF